MKLIAQGRTLPDGRRQLYIRVPGRAVPQGRGRAARVGKGDAQRVVVFDPERSKTWKKTLGMALLVGRQAARMPPFAGALELRSRFVLPRPKSHGARGRERHTQVPDEDNLRKALMDSAKGILWGDDCIVSDGVVQKRWGATGEEPFVEIRLEEVPRVPDDEDWQLERPEAPAGAAAPGAPR